MAAECRRGRNRPTQTAPAATGKRDGGANEGWAACGLLFIFVFRWAKDRARLRPTRSGRRGSDLDCAERCAFAAQALLYTRVETKGWLPALHAARVSVGLSPARNHNILCSNPSGFTKAWVAAQHRGAGKKEAERGDSWRAAINNSLNRSDLSRCIRAPRKTVAGSGSPI